MRYKAIRWTYVLEEDVIVQTELRPTTIRVIKGYARLLPNGKLHIFRGYAWDGCTGAPDREWNMLAGLVHDVLYQMIQLGELGWSHKELCDRQLQKLITIKPIGYIFYLAVHLFGQWFIRRPA